VNRSNVRSFGTQCSLGFCLVLSNLNVGGDSKRWPYPAAFGDGELGWESVRQVDWSRISTDSSLLNPRLFHFLENIMNPREQRWLSFRPRGYPRTPVTTSQEVCGVATFKSNIRWLPPLRCDEQAMSFGRTRAVVSGDVSNPGKHGFSRRKFGVNLRSNSGSADWFSHFASTRRYAIAKNSSQNSQCREVIGPGDFDASPSPSSSATPPF